MSSLCPQQPDRPRAARVHVRVRVACVLGASVLLGAAGVAHAEAEPSPEVSGSGPGLAGPRPSPGGVVGAGAAASDRASAPRPQGPTVMPIVFRVARERGTPDDPEGGAPVIDSTFLAQAVERASEIFAPAGLCFTLEKIVPLPPGKMLNVWGRGARDHLTRVAGPAPSGAVEVFFVRAISNLDGGGVALAGVHWRYPGHNYGGIGRHYVILGQKNGGMETLAHELGHYFGLPHSQSRRNLMRPGSDRVVSGLNRWQRSIIRRRIETFTKYGVLNPDGVSPEQVPGCTPRHAAR
jgi:hypothetical protein